MPFPRKEELNPSLFLGSQYPPVMPLRCHTAELVYGTTLRIPGQFFDPVEEIPDPLSFVSRLRITFSRYRPNNPDTIRTGNVTLMLICSSTHVFVCRDAVRRPLQRPYDGPFKVHCRYPKFFTIIGSTGKPQTTSVDRLKLVHTNNPAVSTSSVPASHQCLDLHQWLHLRLSGQHVLDTVSIGQTDWSFDISCMHLLYAVFLGGVFVVCCLHQLHNIHIPDFITISCNALLYYHFLCA